MTFRPALLPDIPRIHAVRVGAAGALTEKFGAGPWSRVSAFGTIRRALNQARANPAAATLFVLADGGRIAGTCTLDRETGAFYRRLGFSAPDDPAFYMRSMSVDPALQGRGFGRRMMEESERHARRLGLKALRLDAYAAEA